MKKKNEIRRLKIKKENDEINKLCKIYLKNFYEIKNICFYCFVDKNGNNIFETNEMNNPESSKEFENDSYFKEVIN